MAKPGDAYELALSALATKERTEAELAEWLRERGVPEEALAEVLARLTAEGAVDDEEFARRYAEDKRELRAWGPDRIAEALRSRGVGRDRIDAALAVEDVESQIRRAGALLAERRMSCLTESDRGRALGLLARRGFPSEVGYAAIRRHRGSSADGAEEET